MVSSIFAYEQYVLFLKAYVKTLPKRGRGELQKISQKLGIHTTLISQIMSGQRHLTEEQAHELAGYLGLTALEEDYFLLLVQIERAGTENFRKYLKTKLNHLKSEALKISKRIDYSATLTDQEKSEFYSSWNYSAIRLFCSTAPEGKSLEEIISYFHLDRPLAIKYLNFLVKTQLCTEKDGFFKMGTQSTFVEKGSIYFLKHHFNWRIKSIQKSENMSDEDFLFTSPLSISRQDFHKIRDVLAQTVSTSSKIVTESNPEVTACLNLDFFQI